MQIWRMDLWTEWGKERVGQTESSVDIYTLPCVKQTASEKFVTVQEALSGVCVDLVGWQGGRGWRAQEGGDKCIIIVDFHCYMQI